MAAEKKNYNELKSELDELLQWFESSDIEIDKAVKKYEKAKTLIEQLEKLLESSELAVRKLSKKP